MDNNEIKSFITRRWAPYETKGWREGNCYWFAEILCSRFPELEPYYLPVQGHFVAGNRVTKEFWDIDGLHTEMSIPEHPISLQEIKEKDLNWYMRLLRDCKM